MLITFSSYFSTPGLQFRLNLDFPLCYVPEFSRMFFHIMFEHSPVYACLLDASKSFLFSKLLDRGFPVALVCLLISWYKGQRMSVCWDSYVPRDFPTSNGVRQGCVLLPILFTLYIDDDLFVELSRVGVGCRWEGRFAGALCYADNLVLLAPSLAALRIMLRCCESFVASHSLVFNASKTQPIRFSTLPALSCSAVVYFCNYLLAFSDIVCHLGHTLRYDLCDKDDVLFKSRDFIRKANYLLLSFAAVGHISLHVYYIQSVCHFIVLLCGPSAVLQSKLLMFHSTKFYTVFGACLLIATLLIEYRVALLPSFFNVIRRRSLSLLQSAFSCSLRLVQSICR